MIHSHMATTGERRDGERTAMRLARLYVAGDTWRSWRARADDPGERAYAASKQERARAALRTVEAPYAGELDAWLASRSYKLPTLPTGEVSRIIAQVWNVASQRMPLTLAARTAPMAPQASATAAAPRRKRVRVEHEDVIRDIRAHAVQSGDKAIVRDCDLILRGNAVTATQVLGFIEEHANFGGDQLT